MTESLPTSRPDSIVGFALAVVAILALPLFSILFASSPSASLPILVWFYISGCAAVAISLKLPSSFFVFSLSSFLFVGFIAKAIAHFVFGVPLIEPISTFTSEWNRALLFAASGLSGVCLGNLMAALFPSFPNAVRASGTIRLANSVLGAFVLLIVVSVAVYWANYSFHILRIGFPLGVDIDARIYAVAAFIITWGSLLGGLTAGLWLVELRGWPYAALILTATFLGSLASLSMGSRIQLLLYVFAAVAVIVLRRRQVRSWIAVALSIGLAALVFAGSLAVVSLERTYDFSQTAQGASAPPAKSAPQASESSITSEPAAPGATEQAAPAASPERPNSSNSTLSNSPETPQAAKQSRAPRATSLVDKVETVTRNRFALQGLFRQLRNLVIMRWVGMEGVMTAAANSDRLGADLFLEVMSEDPAAGSHAIYQKMSGDRYGNVEYYTFLTLPGPIGAASLSGSPLVVAAFMFALALVGHSIEWVAARSTRNLAAASVTGVSLAYLTVQMGFPWTLLIYAIELLLSVLFVGAVWWITKRLTSNKGRVPVEL